MNAEQLHLFEILARQNESMLLAYVLSLVPEDHQLSEDIVQETFLVAYRKIHSLRDKASFGPWLRGIARHQVYAALRRKGRELVSDPAAFEGLEDVFGGLERQAAACEWHERFRLVEDCFRALPEKLREVCQRHYFDDQPVQTLSNQLSISLAAGLKRLERARDAIRDCVQRRIKLEDA